MIYCIYIWCQLEGSSSLKEYAGPTGYLGTSCMLSPILPAMQLKWATLRPCFLKLLMRQFGVTSALRLIPDAYFVFACAALHTSQYTTSSPLSHVSCFSHCSSCCHLKLKSLLLFLRSPTSEKVPYALSEPFRINERTKKKCQSYDTYRAHYHHHRHHHHHHHYHYPPWRHLYCYLFHCSLNL